MNAGTKGSGLDLAKGIAEAVIAKHDSEIAYPKLMHKAAVYRFDKVYLGLCNAMRDEMGASLMDVYKAAELVMKKYEPGYVLQKARQDGSFS